MENEFFMLLEMLFKAYSLSSCVLIQCFYCVIHVQERRGISAMSHKPQIYSRSTTY